jgi:hypothetical protein
MKIGTLEHSDLCPKCGQDSLIQTSLCESRKETGSSWNVFTIKCINDKCDYESDTYRIKYHPIKDKKIIDITPRRTPILNFLKKLFLTTPKINLK